MILVELDFSPDSCGSSSGFSKYYWLNLLIIIFALVSAMMEIKLLLDTVSTLRKLRNEFIRNQTESIVERADVVMEQNQRSASEARTGLMSDSHIDRMNQKFG